MNQEKIGKKILEIRKNSKLTQKEFADKFGVTYQAVSKWETGETFPDVLLLKPLANELQITVDELITQQKTEDEKIKKILRSVSKMEGIQYYSNSRRRIETLYSKAYTVNNPTERKKIPDNFNFNENPIYVLLDDKSFGEYVSEITNDSKDFENCFEYINIDNINYGFIKAVDPYNMQVFLDVINCKKEIIVYVYIQSKMDVPALFKNKIYDSFIARTDALFDWFKKSWRN